MKFSPTKSIHTQRLAAIKKRKNKVPTLQKRGNKKKQLWRRERPQTCIHNLPSANLVHIIKQHNKKKATSTTLGRATKTQIQHCARRRKERHAQEQNLGYEPHDIIIHELNPHKHTEAVIRAHSCFV